MSNRFMLIGTSLTSLLFCIAVVFYIFLHKDAQRTRSIIQSKEAAEFLENSLHLGVSLSGILLEETLRKRIQSAGRPIPLSSLLEEFDKSSRDVIIDGIATLRRRDLLNIVAVDDANRVLCMVYPNPPNNTSSGHVYFIESNSSRPFRDLYCEVDGNALFEILLRTGSRAE